MSDHVPPAPHSPSDSPSRRRAAPVLAIILSLPVLSACGSGMSVDGSQGEATDFDAICELTTRLEPDLLSESYDAAGNQYADEISSLVVEDLISMEVVQAIWDSAKLEMTDPDGAYAIWTDAAVQDGRPDWSCPPLLSVFEAQTERQEPGS